MANAVPLRSQESRARRLGGSDLMLLGAVLIWGFNFTIVKLALEVVTPLAFNAIRFTVATAVILSIVRLRGENLRIDKRDVMPFLFLGLCGHLLYQVLFIHGLAATTPANSSLLMATSPLWVVLIGSMLSIERANGMVWLGVGTSLVGSIILIVGSGEQLTLHTGTLRGDLLILGAAIMWATYTMASKPLLVRYSPVKVTAISMAIGSVPLVLLSIPQLLAENWGSITLGTWGSVFYSAVFALVVGYTIWSNSVQHVGGARTAVYSNLTPVVALVVGWIVLGDMLTLLQLFGAVVVLSGIVIARRGKQGN